MIFGRCKAHTTRSGAMQILSKFCLNKHLIDSLDGATNDQHDIETIGPMGANDPKIHPFHLRHVDPHRTHECLG